MHPQPLGRPGPRRRPPRRRPRPDRDGLRPRRAPGRRRRRRCPPPAIDAGAARRRCASSLGAEHVLTDDETRRLRTRGKSTPDLLRAARRRPDRRPRRRRAARHATTRSPPSSPAPSSTTSPSSRSAAARRSPAAWSPGARASPAWSRLDLVRMKRLLAVDHVSMTATLEPGLRGPEAEALLAADGLTLGHFPQSFEYATIGGFAATRSSGQSSAGYGRFDALVVGLTRRHPERRARPRQRPGQRRRPRPAPAVPRLRGRLRRDHRRHRAGAHGCPRSRSTRAGAGRPSPTAPPRCAPSPRPACCRP